MHLSDGSLMNGFRCVKSSCDDAGIVNVNISGDMSAGEDRINKEV